MSESNGYAAKEAFFGGFKRRWKEIESPLLGGKVLIGSMSEKEHQRFEKRLEGMRKRKTAEHVRLAYMAECVWLPDRSARMFSDEDFNRLLTEDMDYAVTRQLTDAIVDHLGVGPDDLEELAKN